MFDSLLTDLSYSGLMPLKEEKMKKLTKKKVGPSKKRRFAKIAKVIRKSGLVTKGSLIWNLSHGECDMECMTHNPLIVGVVADLHTKAAKKAGVRVCEQRISKVAQSAEFTGFRPVGSLDVEVPYYSITVTVDDRQIKISFRRLHLSGVSTSF